MTLLPPPSALPEPADMARGGFVICHHPDALQWGQYLQQELSALDLTARLQAVDIRPGDNAIALVDRWLQAAQGVLVVVSQGAFDDAQDEIWTAALGMGLRVVPVVVARDAPVRPMLRALQPLWLHGADAPQVRARLEQALKAPRSGPRVPLPGQRFDTRLQVSQPGPLRWLFDRLAPRLHLALTRRGWLPAPPEMADLHGLLADLRAQLLHELHERSYVPLDAGDVPSPTVAPGQREDPFVRPVQQLIRQVIGDARGGDGASAQLSASSRRSRVVRNIARAVLASRQPIVLLGDPGSGKTMTLQNAVLAVLEREAGRVYPLLPLYLRLGDFHVGGPAAPAPRDVLDFVLSQAPAALAARWDALRAQQRLMVFFDGMDEMSRERYGAHVAALSMFASSAQAAGAVRTLFSCRINDFSPEFKHRRMVLLPFEKPQLREFLERYVPRWPLQLEGRAYDAKALTDRLWSGETPVDPRNPFVLWLLLFYLRARGAWPDNRAALLAFFARRSLDRKRGDVALAQAVVALRRRPFAALGELAYVLMRRNLGTSATLAELRAELPGLDLASLATFGQRCGLLALSTGAATPQLRFAHHRLSEFFAARHICRARVAVDWLALMDAPRWQETLLNVILLSHRVEPVQQLATLLGDELGPLEQRAAENERRAKRAAERAEAQKKAKAAAGKARHKAAKDEAAAAVAELPDAGADDDEAVPLFGPGQETAMADRVELLARLLRQLPRPSAEVMAVFERGVGTLVRLGNPSTQVKMLWAWKNVPVADVGTQMAALLVAPVTWVRQQAMLLVADSPEHRARMRTDTTMLVGLDLARGDLLPQLAQHVQAAARARDRAAWVSLGVGGALALVWLVGLIAIGVAVHRWLPEHLFPTQSMAPWWAPGHMAWLLGAAAVVGVLAMPRYLWLWLGAVTGTILYAAAQGQGLWDSSSPTEVGDRLFSIGLRLAWALLPAAVVAGVWHMLLVGLYPWLGSSWRLAAGRTRVLLEEAFVSCGYLAAAGVGAGVLLATGLVLGYQWLMSMAVRVFDWILQALVSTLGAVGRWFGLAWADEINAALVAATTALLAAALVSLTRHRRTLGGWLQSAFSGAASLAVIGLVFVVVLGPLALWWNWLDAGTQQAIARFAVRAALGLTLATMLAVVALLLWQAALTALVSVPWWRRPFAPGSLSAAQWRALLATRSAHRQALVLQRSSHQALDLDPAAYLLLLESVQDTIRAEPAQGAYWRQRHELEQMLRQEQQGKVGSA